MSAFDTTQHPHVIDRPKEGDSSAGANAALSNVDRVSLLGDNFGRATSGKPAEPKELNFDNVFKSAAVSGKAPEATAPDANSRNERGIFIGKADSAAKAPADGADKSVKQPDTAPEAPKDGAAKPAAAEAPKDVSTKPATLDAPQESSVKPAAPEAPKIATDKPAAPEALKNATDKPAAPEAPKNDPASERSKAEGRPLEILSRPDAAAADPAHRNALVLDNFGSKDLLAQTEAHGELIANGLKANGFNVFEAQTTLTKGHLSPLSNFAPDFEAVNKAIESGQLPLKSGDIITASFGNNAELVKDPVLLAQGKDDPNPKLEGGDPDFRHASKMLGININPQNIKEKTPEIISRLGRLAAGQDPSTGEPSNIDPKTKEEASFAFASNQAIEKLQAKGITVVNAAGNDGSARISLDFLAAGARLSSNGPDGKLDGFSAKDNATLPANGVLPTFEVTPGPLDPTPVAEQKQFLQAGDTKIFHDLPKTPDLPTLELHRDKFSPPHEFNKNEGAVTFANDKQPLPDSVPSPIGVLSQSFPSASQLPIQTGFEKDGKEENFQTVKAKAIPVDIAALENHRRLVGVDAGTSLSVIDFTRGKADRNIPLVPDQ